MSGALDGLKVIDAGILVQGPQAAAYLRDLGADVIKVELPRFGDQSRFIFLSDTDYRSAFYRACNRGKRSLSLDLRTVEGASILKQLIEDTDVLISNFKPGTLEEWGLGYEDLSGINPRLIWAAGSTFGPVGPDSQREGADLSAQCAGGIATTTGKDGESPSPVGTVIADHVGSLNLTIGILAALQHREHTDRGQKVESSLLGGQLWAQASELTHYLLTDEVPGRANYGHPLIRPNYRIFQTADGWIGFIGVPADKFDEFLIAIDRLDLLIDDRSTTVGSTQAKGRGSDTAFWFANELAKALQTKTTDEWCDIFDTLGVRYAPVNDYAAVAANAGAAENGYIQSLTDSTGQVFSAVLPPLRLSETPVSPGESIPDLGEHTDEILKSLGFEPATIDQLRNKGVV